MNVKSPPIDAIISFGRSGLVYIIPLSLILSLLVRGTGRDGREGAALWWQREGCTLPLCLPHQQREDDANPGEEDMYPVESMIIFRWKQRCGSRFGGAHDSSADSRRHVEEAHWLTVWAEQGTWHSVAQHRPRAPRRGRWRRRWRGLVAWAGGQWAPCWARH